MRGTRLQVVFETAEPDAGVPVEDLRLVLRHLAEAIRPLARHLREHGGGGSEPDAADSDACPLRVTGISGGSVVLDLTVAPTGDGSGSEDTGRRAVRAILRGGADEAGAVPPPLPAPVADRLTAIGESLSPAVPLVRLRDPDSDRGRDLRREDSERAIRNEDPAVDNRRPAPEWGEPFDREAFLARPRQPFSFDDLPTIDDLTPEEAETFRGYLRVGRRS